MDKEFDVLKQAVAEAGRAIADMRKKGVEISHKSNNDILTQADLCADNILKSTLTTNFPDYGWLSEESVDDARRLTIKRVWVVDPIDGTKEYAAGIPEYAVSAALVEDGKPVLACVFNPETNEMFSAMKGKGAWLNNIATRCKEDCSDKLTLLASNSEVKRGEWDQFADHDVQSIGSIAYKLALVAAGRADATFSLGPKSEWDIAAGVLLVSEAGGVVFDKSHKEFCFNQKNIIVNGIVASSAAASGRLMEVLESSVSS